MEHDTYNELTAAYALDALDDDETKAYEEHLSGCAICQDTLATLSGTMVQLAFAAPPVDPSPELRGRILDAARAERHSPVPPERESAVLAEPENNNVVPLRPRRTWSRSSTAVAAVVALAACLVIGLGIWNVSLSNQLGDAREAGAVVVGAGDERVLVVSNLDQAPAGKTYEAWVIDDGTAAPAGTFDGGRTVAVKLEHPVRSDSVVAVTVERAGGAQQPTSKPILIAQPV